MKKEKKNYKEADKILNLIICVLVIIAIILVLVRVFNGKTLKTDDELVTELHNYFSSDDLNNCEGLFVYTEGKVEYKDIDEEVKKCLAYQKTDNKVTEEITVDGEKKKETCTYEDMVFRKDKDSNKCTITKVEAKNINETYNKIFGVNPKEEGSFKSSDFNICYVKDGYYYCGLSESFVYTIGGDSLIYRVMQKAVEKGSNIEIYDYFVKINNDKCSKTYTTSTENSECTEAYAKLKKVDYKFMEKYGTRYKHVYKKKDDNTYYWVSSELIER